MDQELIDKIEQRIRKRCKDSGLDDYSLKMYVLHGREPGGFLKAVLEDKLVQAALRADVWNQERLFQWAQVMWYDVPRGARGDKETVTRWINSGGLYGQKRQQELAAAGAS